MTKTLTYFAALAVLGVAVSRGGNNPTGSKNPHPSLISVSPDTLAVGSHPILRVIGSGFLEDSQGRWDGDPRQTTYLSSESLLVSLAVILTVPDVTAPPDTQGIVQVFNPPPVGGISNRYPVKLDPRTTNPLPVLTGIDPDTAVVNEGFSLRLFGSGFNQNTRVDVSGKLIIFEHPAIGAP